MKPIARQVLGLTLLALPVFLSACADKDSRYSPVRPPAVLLQELPEPKVKGQTNADLVSWALELREALRMANSDKRALREWLEGH